MTAFPSLAELSDIADTMGLRTTGIRSAADMSHALDRMLDAADRRDDAAYAAAKADFDEAANASARRAA